MYRESRDHHLLIGQENGRGHHKSTKDAWASKSNKIVDTLSYLRDAFLKYSDLGPLPLRK